MKVSKDKKEKKNKRLMWRRVSGGDTMFVSERVRDNERRGKEILQRKNTSITEEKERVNREREIVRRREREKRERQRDRRQRW